VEAVAALRPDLVLMAGDGPLVKQLERLGVPVLVLSPQRHADVADTLARLGGGVVGGGGCPGRHAASLAGICGTIHPPWLSCRFFRADGRHT